MSHSVNSHQKFAAILKQKDEPQLQLFTESSLSQDTNKDNYKLHGNKFQVLLYNTSDFPPAPPLPEEFNELSPRDISGVEKFTFFVGYGRSGHSVVAGIMDAHPDVIVAHEFYLFDKLANIHHRSSWSKQNLFNRLYLNSFISAKSGWRSNKNTSKGYNLSLEGSWQGQFRNLRVIGDKTAGATAMQYHMSNSLFKINLKRLGQIAGVPLRLIHVVRNPYDMIATVALYHASPQPNIFRRKATRDQPYGNATAIRSAAMNIQSKAMSVQGIAKIRGIQILEIHLEDLIKNSKEVIEKICVFLGISCPDGYVQICQRKVYSRASQSRHLVEWSTSTKIIVEKMIEKLPFFNRYSFLN